MAQKAYESSLSIAGDVLGELLELVPMNMTRSSIDTTHMASADEVRTKLGGLIDPGQVTAKVQLEAASADTANHVKALNALKGSGVPAAFVAKIGNIATWTGTAFVSGFAMDALVPEGKQVATITLEVSGMPTLANVSD